MTYRLFAFIIFFLSPAALAAQQVSVRSGDHEEFVRLVFNLPSRSDWTLVNNDSGAELRIAAGGLTFDTSEVFKRITRERISDISFNQSSQTVTLEFACDCVAEGFWFDRTMLVVDVRQKKPEEMRDKTAQVTSIRAAPDLGSIERVPDLPLQSGARSVALMNAALSAQLKDTPRSGLRVNENGQRQTSLHESRDRLLQQIGRATSQGLLSPKSKKPVLEQPEHEITPQEAARPEHRQAVVETPKKPKKSLHINVRTSIDQDFLDRLGASDAEVLTDGCLESALFDVAAWGNEKSFWEQVGPLRSRMTSEFDRNNDEAIRQLARLYLFFGFGLEAMQVIELLPPDEIETEALAALAQIMETGFAPDSVLVSQFECAAPVAMWSALAHTRLPSDARLDKDAIIRGFSTLPRHLRSHLGPLLAARLFEASHEKESASILRILERVDDTKSTASDLAAADLDLASGAPVEAEERLTAVIEANDVLSPQALVLQIDSQLKRNERVSFDLAQLAAAYAFEYSDDPMGADLTRAHILALGASGAFQDAFDQLDALQQTNAAPAAKIRIELVGLLAAQAEQIEILRHVLSGDAGNFADLKPETALKIADELLEAGFHEQSSEVLSRSFVGAQNRPARLLRARAALAADRPRQAEVELLGLSGHDANVLRARARSMTGEHRQAYELFKSAGMDDEASREAWLAENSSPAEGEDLAFAEETNTQKQGILARNKALLEAVDNTRGSLEILLNQAPSPDPDI